MRQLRVLMLLDSIPHDRHGGGGITELGLARILRGISSVRLTLLALNGLKHLHGAEPGEAGASAETLFESVNSLEGQIDNSRGFWSLPGFSILGIDFSLSRFRKGYAHRSQVSRFVRNEEIDIVISYGWDALQAASQVSRPVIALLGDPIARPFLYRRTLFPDSRLRGRHRFILSIHRLFLRAWAAMSSRRLLRRAQIVGAFAHHHAREYELLSGRRVDYVQTPVYVSQNVPLSKVPSHSQVDKGPLRLGLIGHLNGTATLQGLSEFQRSLLPRIAELVSSGSISLKIAGGYIEAVPVELRESLEKSGALFVGQVWPPEDFFSDIDLLLVPTSIPLGIRVRILTAQTLGIPVLAHESAKLGIPELANSENSYLYETAHDFASKISELMSPSVRHSVAKAGFLTVLKDFSVERGGCNRWMVQQIRRLQETSLQSQRHV